MGITSADRYCTYKIRSQAVQGCMKGWVRKEKDSLMYLYGVASEKCNSNVPSTPNFIISYSNPSASPCASVRSCVLQHFILPCSNFSASPHLSTMFHVLWSFYYHLIWPQCFYTCKSNVLCTPTFYSLLLWPQCFCTSISNALCTLIILLSSAPTPVLLHMHEPCSVCSDILFSPALIPVLLCIYPQWSMYSNHLASPALTTVLLHMNEPCPVCSNILFSPAPTSVLLHIHQQCPKCSNHLTSPASTPVLLHINQQCSPFLNILFSPSPHLHTHETALYMCISQTLCSDCFINYIPIITSHILI